MPHSFRPHELQHAKLSCPSLSSGHCSNSFIKLVMPSNHLIHCSPLLLLSSILPSIKIFSMSWLFTSSGQDIVVSASVSVLPINIQGLFPLGLTILISLQSKWLSRVFSSTTIQTHQFFGTQTSFMVQFSSVHNYWINNSFDYINFCLGTNLTEKPNL